MALGHKGIVEGQSAHLHVVANLSLALTLSVSLLQ